MVPHTKAEPRQMAQEFDRLIDDALDTVTRCSRYTTCEG
jgi:hypothetical protein